MNQNTKVLVGALIAAVLAFAVYYGLLSPQSATTIQNQANQTLGTAPASQTSAPQIPAPQAPTPAPTTPAPLKPEPMAPASPAPAGSAPQPTAPAPQQ